MGLIMNTGSVIKQLNDMNTNLDIVLVNASSAIATIASFDMTRKLLRGTTYDLLRTNYSDIHIPIIHGIIAYIGAFQGENKAYKTYIDNFLSGIGYIDEDALKRDKHSLEAQISYVRNAMRTQNGCYSDYLGCLERALELIENKLKKIENFIWACNGLYDGLNSYKTYIQMGINTITNSTFDIITGTYLVDLPSIIWQNELERKWQEKQKYDLLPEELRKYLNVDDFEYTDDGFVLCMVPLSDILLKMGITDTSISDVEDDVNLYYDDWHLYAVQGSDGNFTYSLLKMREQENDGGDNDDPGVTISFIEFNIDKLTEVLPNNTDAFVEEINKVVSNTGQKHNENLQIYFSDINSKASYLIADKYIDKIASTCEDNKIVLPNKLADAPDRVIDQLNDINEKAGITIYDSQNKCINIQDPNNLTEEEKYVILAAYTSNLTYNSFAAEVKFHSDALIDWKKNIPFVGKKKWYEAAIRADMAIGEEKESNKKGGFDDYYDLESDMVNDQKEVHGER